MGEFIRAPLRLGSNNLDLSSIITDSWRLSGPFTRSKKKFNVHSYSYILVTSAYEL